MATKNKRAATQGLEGLDNEQTRELLRLRIQREQLELEDLQMSVENERNRRAGLAQVHAAQQKSLDDFNRDVRNNQAACKHRKGGKDMQGILNGHDAYYSVIHHTYPAGHTNVMCTRCSKEWQQPDTKLRYTNPQLFNKQFEEWKWAMELPTDNEPSGTQLFQIIDNSHLVRSQVADIQAQG